MKRNLEKLTKFQRNVPDRQILHTYQHHLTRKSLDPCVFAKGFGKQAMHQVIEDLKRQGAIMRVYTNVQCQQISMRGWIADKC